MKLLLRSVFIITTLSLGGLLICLLFLDYDTLIRTIANFSDSEKYTPKIKELIQPHTITLITVFIIMNMVISLIFFFRLNAFIDALRNFISKTLFSIACRAKNDLNREFLCIIFIPFLCALYFAITMPVGNDEGYTYVNYTSRSIFTAALYYPDPNNHILHSIIISLFSILPVSAQAGLRIPIILISTLNLFVFYSLIKEFFNKNLALITISIYSVFMMTIYYSYVSRGYTLQLFAFLMITFSVFKILSQPKNNFYWWHYSLASFIGFYTIPSFLYPFLIVNLFLLLNFQTITREYLKYNIAVAYLIIHFYTPVFIINGFQAVTSNKFVIPIDRQTVLKNLPEFICTTINDITGLPFLLVLLLTIPGIYLIHKHYHQKKNYYFLFIIIISPLLLIVHSVLPFSRTFNFWGVSLALFMAIMVTEFLKKRPLDLKVIVVLICFQLLMVYNFTVLIKPRESNTFAAQSEIAKIQSGKNFYVSTKLFDNYLTYNLKSRKINDYYIKHYLATPINMDTVSNKNSYDFLIIDNYLDSTKIMKPFSKNEAYTIYRPAKN